VAPLCRQEQRITQHIQRIECERPPVLAFREFKFPVISGQDIRIQRVCIGELIVEFECT
jgi:hypothetical protein